MGGDFNLTRDFNYHRSRFDLKSIDSSLPISAPVDLEKDTSTEEDHPTLPSSPIRDEIDSKQEIKSKEISSSSVLVDQLESKFLILLRNLESKLDKVTDRKPQDINIVVAHSQPIESETKIQPPSKQQLEIEPEVQRETPIFSNQSQKWKAAVPVDCCFWNDPANVAMVQALIIVGIVFLGLLIGYIIFLFVHKASNLKQYRSFYPL